MSDTRIEAITALLAEAEQAHGLYEQTELDGVYDQEWARWYASYAVEHGIGESVGHPVGADDLATFLARSFVDFKQAMASEPWGTYTARRIADEL